jgi:GT2 family glycosyltransferase
MHPPSSFPFQDLPPDVRLSLLAGGTGKIHLLSTADRALEYAAQLPEQQKLLLSLGADLLWQAWNDAPLDGGLARNILEIHKVFPFLPPQGSELLHKVSSVWSPPENTSYMAHLFHKKELAKLKGFLNRQREKEPGNLFWTQQTLDLLYLLGEFEEAGAVIDLHVNEALLPLRNKHHGDVLFCQGRYDQAAVQYALAGKSLPSLGAFRLAETLYRTDERNAAVTLWAELHRRLPWQVNVTLRLHDILHGLDESPRPLTGNTAICLYTWNKKNELDACLSALSQGLDEGAWIIALDNGSSDGTAEILRAWQERLSGTMETVTLPTNIGAPGARNWLKSLPQVRSADWVVFLDDDALLPVDWSRRFRTAVDAYPEAGVWGCRIQDDINTSLLQHVDLHLREEPERPGDGSMESAFSPHFSCFDLHCQDLDFGQFTYLRPCASVTGCCHLFRGGVLAASPDFDLRYSPTQYDDLDHDIQMNLAGTHPVYQGHLCVRHLCKSGRMTVQSRAQSGISMANRYKMNEKFGREQIRRIIEQDLLHMEADLGKKTRKLGEKLTGQES